MKLAKLPLKPWLLLKVKNKHLLVLNKLHLKVGDQLVFGRFSTKNQPIMQGKDPLYEAIENLYLQ